jgi:hypothetical protein
MHVHYLQEKASTVVRGRVGYQRAGQEARFAGPGDTVVFRAGEPHRFWNAGEDDLHCTAYDKPRGNAEHFVGALFAPEKRNGGRRPTLLDIAFLTRRYRSEHVYSDAPPPLAG